MFNLGVSFIIILAFLGLGVSLKINGKKKEERPFVCPIGFECDKVVKSQYGTFFGVNVEKWGMGYYSLVAIFYVVAFFNPVFLTGNFSIFSVSVSAGAFFFSLYLTMVQAFLLRSWCSYCLSSALLSTGIFFIILMQFF